MADELMSDLGCGICREIMFEPVTVPCGMHSFCAACIISAAEAVPPADVACPMCREKFACAKLFDERTGEPRISITLRSVCRKAIGAHKYDERVSEIKKGAQSIEAAILEFVEHASELVGGCGVRIADVTKHFSTKNKRKHSSASILCSLDVLVSQKKLEATSTWIGLTPSKDASGTLFFSKNFEAVVMHNIDVCRAGIITIVDVTTLGVILWAVSKHHVDGLLPLEAVTRIVSRMDLPTIYSSNLSRMKLYTPEYIATRHCLHCTGFDDCCACEEHCVRPPLSKCREPNEEDRTRRALSARTISHLMRLIE